jgi:O-acetyl-ADP-ribose deacetylase (regulator of RNase III)
MFNKASLKYIDGDATAPIGKGLRVIVHCCNDIGGWGAGFVLALSRKWEAPEKHYRVWHKSGTAILGAIQLVPVGPKLKVCNMIGQHGCGTDEDGNPPVRYEAIRKGLASLAKELKPHWFLPAKGSVHAPKFGADLAGGDWNIIEGIIKDELVAKGINVTVYNWVG